MWIVYELLLLVAFLFYVPKALWRRRLPHPGWSMRLGRYPAEVQRRLTNHEAIWVHAVSVGEVLAARPLIQALARSFPQQPIVLSTITPSGFTVASQQLGQTVIPIYLPLDLRGCVRRALDAMHPRLLVLMESELWPVMIDRTQRRGIPVVVVNGRMSAKAFRRYQRVKPWLRGMMTQVNLFLMQTQADADRVMALGAPPDRVRVTGSLKWDASLGTRPSAEAIHTLATRLGLNGQAPVLVGGSTHRGEEGPLVHTLKELRRAYPTARLILAPRHLERLGDVEDLIRTAGLISVRLSQVTGAQPWDVGIVDTFGQLSLYYGLASVVFVGGSLIPHGGQNPLEAASLGKPVIFGPYMHNFAEIAEQLVSRQAARQLVRDAELPQAFMGLLANPPEAQAMGRRAQDIVERCRGTTQRLLDALTPFLTPSASRT